MRILHISTRLILGGSQENTVLSCEGQARLGHDVHLAFGPIYGPEGSLLDRVRAFTLPRGAGVPPAADEPPASTPAITTHVLPHLTREINPYADTLAYHELKRLIHDLRPDIIHTHSSKAGILGRAAAWSVRRAGVPFGIVHTIHGPPFMPLDGPPLARAKTRLNNRIYTLAERFAARRCDTIISVADAMTREFLARGIGRPDQYTTIRSGMETAPFLYPAPGQSRDEIRAALGLQPGDFVVGTVARLAQHKGHDDLLDALGDELKRSPHLKLLWVGDGWWRARLIAKAHQLGFAVCELDRTCDSTPSLRHSATPSLLLTGLVPPDHIPGLIRAMDVLAHPSYREGLPRTVPQALLCGVCPVAYDCDGTGEVLRDGQTGRLIPVGDREGLRRAVVYLIEHNNDRRAMTERGRAECAEAFSATRMIQELESIYARTLRATGSPALRGQPV